MRRTLCRRGHVRVIRMYTAFKTRIDSKKRASWYLSQPNSGRVWWHADNPEDGRGRTKPISQAEAIEELVQTVNTQ